MRSGDTVLHKPTGERWVLAYCCEGEVGWYGWPPGHASAADCELIEACDDAEHERCLREWAEKVPREYDGYDRRISIAKTQLAALAASPTKPAADE